MAADVRKGEPVTYMPTETVKPDPEDTEEIRNRQDIVYCDNGLAVSQDHSALVLMNTKDHFLNDSLSLTAPNHRSFSPTPPPFLVSPDPRLDLSNPSSPEPQLEPSGLSTHFCRSISSSPSPPDSPLIDPVTLSPNSLSFNPPPPPLIDCSLIDPFSPPNSPFIDSFSPPNSPFIDPGSYYQPISPLQSSSTYVYLPKLKDFEIRLERLSKRKLAQLLRPKKSAKNNDFVLDLSSEEDEENVQETAIWRPRKRKVYFIDSDEEESSVSRDELYHNQLSNSIHALMEFASGSGSSPPVAAQVVLSPEEPRESEIEETEEEEEGEEMDKEEEEERNMDSNDDLSANRKVKFSSQVTLLPSFLPAKLSYRKHQQNQKQPKQQELEQQEEGSDGVRDSEDTPPPTDFYPFYLPAPILKRRKGDNPTTKTSRPKRSCTVSWSGSNSVPDPNYSPVSRREALKDDGDVMTLRKKKKKKGNGFVGTASSSRRKSPRNQTNKTSTANREEEQTSTANRKEEQTSDLTCTETADPIDEYIYDHDSDTTWDEEYEQLWADDDYVDVLNAQQEKGFQRLDRPRRTNRRNSDLGLKDNPLVCNRGCQVPDVKVTGRSSGTTGTYYRGRRGPVPNLDASTQTGVDGPVHSPSAKIFEDARRQLLSEGRMGGGSLWLLKEPVYCNLASRCVPVCTNLTKILRKKHSGAKNLVGVVNNVLGVVEDEVGGALPIELPENIKEMLYKLWNLFIELKEVDIEWPFWRQVSVLAIAINHIFLLSSCEFDTVVTFRTSRYKYHTTGVSSLLLGRIIADMSLVFKALVDSINSNSCTLPESFKESITTGYKMAGYVQFFIKTGCHEPDISLDEFVDDGGEESEVSDRDEYLAELAESKLNIRMTEANILETYHLIHAIVPKVLSDITSIGFYPFRCLPCEYKYPVFKDSFIVFRADRASKPPYCKVCKLPLPSLQSYKVFFSSLTNHHWANLFAASRNFEKMKSIISHRTTSVSSSSLPPRAIPADPDSKVNSSDSQEPSAGDSSHREGSSEKVPISSLNDFNQRQRAMLLQIKNSRQRAINSRIYGNSDSDEFYGRNEREKLKSDSSNHFVSVLNVLRHKRALKRRQLQHQLQSLANRQSNSKNIVTLRNILAARGIGTRNTASGSSSERQVSSRPGLGDSSQLYSPLTRVLNDLLTPDMIHPSSALGRGSNDHNLLHNTQSSSSEVTSPPSSGPQSSSGHVTSVPSSGPSIVQSSTGDSPRSGLLIVQSSTSPQSPSGDITSLTISDPSSSGDSTSIPSSGPLATSSGTVSLGASSSSKVSSSSSVGVSYSSPLDTLLAYYRNSRLNNGGNEVVPFSESIIPSFKSGRSSRTVPSSHTDRKTRSSQKSKFVFGGIPSTSNPSTNQSTSRCTCNSSSSIPSTRNSFTSTPSTNSSHRSTSNSSTSIPSTNYTSTPITGVSTVPTSTSRGTRTTHLLWQTPAATSSFVSLSTSSLSKPHYSNSTLRLPSMMRGSPNTICSTIPPSLSHFRPLAVREEHMPREEYPPPAIYRRVLEKAKSNMLPAPRKKRSEKEPSKMKECMHKMRGFAKKGDGRRTRSSSKATDRSSEPVTPPPVTQSTTHASASTVSSVVTQSASPHSNAHVLAQSTAPTQSATHSSPFALSTTHSTASTQSNARSSALALSTTHSNPVTQSSTHAIPFATHSTPPPPGLIPVLQGSSLNTASGDLMPSVPTSVSPAVFALATALLAVYSTTGSTVYNANTDPRVSVSKNVRPPSSTSSTESTTISSTVTSASAVDQASASSAVDSTSSKGVSPSTCSSSHFTKATAVPLTGSSLTTSTTWCTTANPLTAAVKPTTNTPRLVIGPLTAADPTPATDPTPAVAPLGTTRSSNNISAISTPSSSHSATSLCIVNSPLPSPNVAANLSQVNTLSSPVTAPISPVTSSSSLGTTSSHFTSISKSPLPSPNVAANLSPVASSSSLGTTSSSTSIFATSCCVLDSPVPSPNVAANLSIVTTLSSPVTAPLSPATSSSSVTSLSSVTASFSVSTSSSNLITTVAQPSTSNVTLNSNTKSIKKSAEQTPPRSSSVSSTSPRISTVSITNLRSPYLSNTNNDKKIRICSNPKSYNGLTSPAPFLKKAKLLLSVIHRDDLSEADITISLPSDFTFLKTEIKSYEIRFAWVTNKSSFLPETCRKAVWFSLGLINVEPGYKLPLTVTMHNLRKDLSHILVVIGRIKQSHVVLSDIKFVS